MPTALLKSVVRASEQTRMMDPCITRGYVCASEEDAEDVVVTEIQSREPLSPRRSRNRFVAAAAITQPGAGERRSRSSGSKISVHETRTGFGSHFSWNRCFGFSFPLPRNLLFSLRPLNVCDRVVEARGFFESGLVSCGRVNT